MPYPAVMRRWPNAPRAVPAADFAAQPEAAAALRCAVLTVGVLISAGRLEPAECDGVAGVTRASLAAELQRRERPFWRLRVLASALARGA